MQSQEAQSLGGIPMTLALDKIDVKYNPRQAVDADLVDSIRAQGVLTPLLVRAMDGGRYELVAGGRRFAASTQAGLQEVPVLVRVMSDEQAERAALAENVDRKPLDALDEAEAAARVLGHHQGDRDLAAAAMGWKPDFLDRRLALMACAPQVRKALREKSIAIGHAELLAALRQDKQEAALAAIVNAQPRPSVADFKAMIERMALSLTSAIFDKAECVGCKHNSGHQRTMFSEVVADALCTNKVCFENKTTAELEARADRLRETYQQVRIVRPGDNFTVQALRADGPRGVGSAQAAACRSCANFGAVVSALPNAFGTAYTDQCMDTVCNTAKVAARIRSEQEAQQQQQQQDTADEQASEAKSGGDAAPAKAKPAKASAGSAKPQAKEPTVTVSRSVVEYREKVWRAIFARVAEKADPMVNRAVLLALCVTQPNAIDEHSLAAGLKKAQIKLQARTHSPSEALADALALSREHLAQAIHLVAANTSTHLSIHNVTLMLDVLKVSMEDHWKVTADYLNLLTKNEIDALAQELGVKAAMGQGYAKAMTGKKEEIIKAVLAAPGFDFKGKIPRNMRW